MATRAEYINKNLTVVRELIRIGELSPTTMTYYNAYCYYSSLKNKSVMQRYSITADEMKIKEETVRKAVARMKKRI